MPDVDSGEPNAEQQEDTRPHSGHGCVDLAADPYYWYYRWREMTTGDCPRCGHDHLWIRRHYYNRHHGWNIRCQGCRLSWSEPQITVKAPYKTK